MRIDVEGLGIVEIDSLADVPMLLELLDEGDSHKLNAGVTTNSQVSYPKRAVVRISPEDVDADGNILKADVEFFYEEAQH